MIKIYLSALKFAAGTIGLILLLSGSFNKLNAQDFYDGFYEGGLDGAIRASLVMDETLYISGDFTWFNGEVRLNSVARFNDETAGWESLGAGLEGRVNDIVVFEEQLYAAGLFTSVDDSDIDNIAKWNPDSEAWEAVGGGLNREVYKLAVHQNELHAAGEFNRDGDNNTVERIARLDAETGSWQQVGDLLSLPIYIVYSLGGELYIYHSSNIKRWDADASEWQEVGSFFGNIVFTMAEFDGELYAGGRFGTVGNQTARRIVRFDTDTQDWIPVGDGVYSEDAPDQVVWDFAEYDGDLYAVGQFDQSWNTSLSNVARLDTSDDTWHRLTGSPTTGAVYTATNWNGRMLLGGRHFNLALGYQNMAAYDGDNVSGLAANVESQSVNGRINALTSHQGRIFAGGSFNKVGDQATNAFAILNTDTGTWTPVEGSYYDVTDFATTASGTLYAAIIGEDNFTGNQVRPWDDENQVWGPATNFGGMLFSLSASGDDLIAGGFFNSLINLEASNIARLQGGEDWAAMGEGFNDLVFATAVHNGEIYAGGRFTQSGAAELSYVARWNEDGQVWEAVGPGLSNEVHALHSHDGALYAAGRFTQSGGETVLRVARFNETTQLWEQVGEGLNTPSFGDFPRTLASFNGDLYVGGSISGSGSSPLSNLARYDAASGSWQDVNGGTDDEVMAFAVQEELLFLGGAFKTAGDVAAARLTALEVGPLSTEPEPHLPAGIRLSQNYPNPFNPATLIEYELAGAGTIQLEVFNLMGQRVAVLHDGPQAAGIHTVSFDATALASGVYIYRLQSAGSSLIRKMSVIK